MTESEVWNWLEFFRDNFLNQITFPLSKPSEIIPDLTKETKDLQLRSKYCRTRSNRQMKGSTKNWQVDFLTKGIELPSSQIHEWCIKNMMTNFLTKLSCVNLMQIITLDLFSPSFVELKKLATSLRTVLFGDGGIDFQTPDDHERIYKDMITAFNKTIDQIKGKFKELFTVAVLFHKYHPDKFSIN
ncbi:Bgt-51408 [Blumeria graminis f. sp. tritici]|uniref:Bgt-51408 n=1 Tax=Blumeria graminis f. sp. tritici TaxID=62690 RepID=A0A9X9QE01_BLUGR|nr:Bgt-51408 [Blumeria graminis f. sp. tritici]